MIKKIMRMAALLLLGVGSAKASDTCKNENTAIPFSTPTSDFMIHDNGTVTHNPTGLMWMRCSVGQSWDGNTCIGAVTRLTWQNALAQTGTIYAGYSDWRLPNKNELASIVEERCWRPSINTTIFPNNITDWYWTSSPFRYDSSGAFAIKFDFGSAWAPEKNSSYHFSKYYVRLVRAGQTNAGPDRGDGPTPVPGSIASVALPNLAQHQVVFQLEGQPKNHIVMMFDEKPRMEFYSVGIDPEDGSAYINDCAGCANAEWQQTATKLQLTTYISDTSNLELTTSDGMLRLGKTYSLSNGNEALPLRVKTIYPYIQQSWQISDITGYKLVVLSLSDEPYAELTFYPNQRLHTNHGEYLWRYSGDRDIELYDDEASTWRKVSWLRDWQNWQTGWRGSNNVRVISVYPVALDE